MSIIDPLTGLRTPAGLVPGSGAYIPMGGSLPGATVSPLASAIGSAPGGLGALSGEGGVLARGLGSIYGGGFGGGAYGGAAAIPPYVGPAAGFAGDLSGLAAAGTGGASNAGLVARGAGLFANPSFSMAKAFGYPTAGLVASGLIDKTNIGGQNSNIEQGLQGAAAGAGVGAGIGSIFPGIGTATGAAVGGLAGGAIGILGNMFGGGGDGEDAPDPIDIINNAVNTAGLDQSARDQIVTTYATMMSLAEQYPDGSDQRKAAEQQALDQAAGLVVQFLGQREQAQTQASNTLALQAQAQQIFAPIAQNITDSAAMYADAMKGIEGNLPPQYRAIAQANVARELNSAERMAAAYQAQAAITPVVDQLTQYQRDFNNYAAQQFSQAMAQQAAGGSRAGGQDVASLLAAAGL